MSTKKLLICILFFNLLTGCIPVNESINTPFPTAPITQVFASPSLSGVSESPTPIITDTAAVPTLMSVPTLGTEDAFGVLRNYLKNKPPCQLPCWGGITPGKSTLSDVQEQLALLSGISKYIYYGEAGDSWIVGNQDFDLVEEKGVISINSSYLASTSNETILLVGISTGSTESTAEGAVYAGRDHNELFFSYTLPQIILTYGLPTQTFMTANINVAEPTSPDFFVIRLLYPDLGIFVRYTMPMKIGDTNFRFCPYQSVIYLDLIPQGHSNDYKDLFEQSGTLEWSLSPDSSYDKSTEEALGMADDEFYRFITSSPTQCFESPINAWPEP